jgi:hypothetical protein
MVSFTARLGIAITFAFVAAEGCSSSSSPTTHKTNPTPTGVTVLFDAAADFDSTAHFFDFPWPSDLRLSAAGTPDLTGIANPLPSAVLEGMRTIAEERKGYPMVPVGWFRFTADLAPRVVTDLIAASPKSPILLIDVQKGSPTLGKLVPTIAETIVESQYVPSSVLGVSLWPGYTLEPSHQYAFVVMVSANDNTGKPLGVAPALAKALAGGTDPVAKLYSTLPPALKKAGVDVSKVAAATVFTTGDVVTDLYNMSTSIFAQYAPLSITNLAVDSNVLDTNARFCELEGQITYPQFQPGGPPYNTGGLFVLDSKGIPIKQSELTVPITITLPKSPMPAGGYPLIVYFHGTGGRSTDIADRGTWRPEMAEMDGGTTSPNCPIGVPLDTWNNVTGCTTPGQGPGWVVAPYGFAIAASALPVNPQRWPAGQLSSLPEWININNVAPTRDIFRQGVVEERLFIGALKTLTIDPSVVSVCTGMGLPSGETAYHFLESPLLSDGQSMGAMYANMISSVEPRIKEVLPTGAGGYWSWFILQTQTIPNVKGDLALLLGIRGNYSHLHPAMHIVELALEPVDPIVFMPRLGRNPLPGHPVRPVYEPHGLGDSYFPTDVQDACALSYGNKEAGQIIWSSMQTDLELQGLQGILPYPVANDLTSGSGSKYTGVAVEYDGDGVYDPHAIAYQLDSVKYQYGCFFKSFLDKGTATVPAPTTSTDDAGTFSVPCPE